MFCADSRHVVFVLWRLKVGGFDVFSDLLVGRRFLRHLKLVVSTSLCLRWRFEALYHITANPVQDEAGRLRYIVLIAVDDTDRREAEVRCSIRRASPSRRHGTGMAHELNQPLAVIRMSTEGLLEELDMLEADAMPVDMSISSGASSTRSASRSSAPRAGRDSAQRGAQAGRQSPPFDWWRRCASGADLLREQLQGGPHRLSARSAGRGPMVKGDANQLQQV